MPGLFDIIYQRLRGRKAISHRPDLANRVHVYSEYSDSRAQPSEQADDYYEIYGSYVWARKAIGKIAENVRSQPIYVYDRNNEILERHILSRLFQRGNDSMSPSQFWETYVIYLMLSGEAPVEVVADGRGRPAEMWLREPQHMYVQPDITPERIYYPSVAGYIYRPEHSQGKPVEYDPQYIIFDKLFNPQNPWRGIAPIHAVREGITIDLFSQAYAKTFLRNNARPDFAVVTKQLLTEGERDRIETEFLHRHSGAEKWHRPAILEDGAEIAPFSFAPKDTEWLEQRRFSRDEVGAIFGVPDEIMGYGKDTYENFQTALETFWTLTLKPLCDHRDDVLNHHFRYRWPILREGEYIATDLSGVGVIQEDMLPRVQMAEVMVRMGYDLNTVNERFELGMPDIEEEPDTPPVVEVVAAPQDDPVPADGQAATPKAIVYLPQPVKDALRLEVNRALEIRQRLLAGENFDEERWRSNAVKAFRQWLDAPMAVRLADAITVRADVDALLSVAIGASQEDGTAEDSPFSGLISGGRITPDLWRQAKNTLLLDPDDPEAEQLARMAIERRTARELQRGLEEWLRTAIAGLTEEEVQQIAFRLRNNQMLFRDLLQRALVQSADLGVSVAIEQFENVGYGFDWTLANVDARDWARRYTDDLLARLNTTNDRIVGEAVARWVENGEPLDKLVDDLADALADRKRAELIASTEVTRAYAEGNLIAYQQSGVVSRVEWRTANDERVCFPAWTMVTTETGQRPIQNIRPGDRVLTRKGYKRVLATSKRPYTGIMTTLETEVGRLTSTADHPIWESEQGWLQAGQFAAGDSVQSAGNVRRQVLSVRNFRVGNASNSPSVSLKVASASRLLGGILMPVFAVNLQRDLDLGQSKVNAVSSDLTLLNVCDADGVQCKTNGALGQRLTAESSIASKAAKLPVEVCGFTPELSSAVATRFNYGRTSTFFGAKPARPSLLIAQKSLSASLAGMFDSTVSALPTTCRVAMGDALGNFKFSPAHRTYFFDHVWGSVGFIALPTAIATASFNLRLLEVGRLAAHWTRQFAASLRESVIATPRAKDIFGFEATGLRKWAVALGARVFKWHAGQLLSDLIVMHHRMLGNPLDVYDVQVEDEPEFYANGILVHNCPICGPLGGIAQEKVGTEQPKLGEGGNVTASVTNPQFRHPHNGILYGVPPAHPRCRCWIVPVVEDVPDV